MLDLTNRELVSGLMVALFVAMFTLEPSLRAQVGPAAIAVVRTFFVWRIQVSLALFGAYLAGCVTLAHRLGLWDLGVLKDTIFVAAFVGVPMFFGAHQIANGKALIRTATRTTVGLSALLAAYLGLGPLPIWGELLLQPPVIVLGALSAHMAHFAKTDAEKVAETVVNVVLSTIGLFLIVHTIRTILSWNSADRSDALAGLAVSVWIPVALIPFLYCASFVMKFGQILSVLPILNDRTRVALRVRASCLIGLRGSTRLVSELDGSWRVQIAHAGGFAEGLRIMRDFRRAVRRYDNNLEEFHRLRAANIGRTGSDSNGLHLDRREFHETKDVLDTMNFQQAGDHPWNQKSLWLNAELLAESILDGSHIETRIKSDGKAWMAWRQTPGGYYFGVGGTSKNSDHWKFDGRYAPSRFPSEDAAEWINESATNSMSNEWSHDDEEPALS